MFFTRYQLMREVLGGALVRAMATKEPFGNRSESTYRKSIRPNLSRVTDNLPWRWVASRYGPEYREYSPKGQIPGLSRQDCDVMEFGTSEPSLGMEAFADSVEEFESAGEGVAPIYFYLLRDIEEPFKRGSLISMKGQILASMHKFPYCYWLERETQPGGLQTALGVVDSYLLYLACLYVDSEIAYTLDELVDKVLLPGVHASYAENYGVSRYIDYRLTHLKRSGLAKIEDFYDIWDSWGDGADRDSIVKRVGRWRRGESTPSPKYFFQFVQIFGAGRAFRRMLGEFALIGVFHAVQLIQKCRNDGDIEPDARLETDSFYRERVYFWHEKLTEHYADILTRRLKERDVEGGLD